MAVQLAFGLAQGITQDGFRQVAMLGQAGVVGFGESAGMLLQHAFDTLSMVVEHNVIERDRGQDWIVGGDDDPVPRGEQFPNAFEIQIRQRGRWRGVRRQLCEPCSDVGGS